MQEDIIPKWKMQMVVHAHCETFLPSPSCTERISWQCDQYLTVHRKKKPRQGALKVFTQSAAYWMCAAVKWPCKRLPFLLLTLVSPSLSILHLHLHFWYPLVWMTKIHTETIYLRQKSLICPLPLCLQVEKLCTVWSYFFFGFHFTLVCGKAELSGKSIKASGGSTT